jgi:flagellar basal-body rod protein FlgB
VSEASVSPIGNDLTEKILGYALDGLSLQENVIANNVANDQTPNFLASDVDFQSSLAQAIQTPGSGATASATVFNTADPPGTDGNNVNLATELVEASRATLQYQAVVHGLNFKYNELAQAMGMPAVTP